MPPEATRTPPRLRSHGFGLAVESDREIVGLSPGGGPASGPATSIELFESPPEQPTRTGREVRRVTGPDGEVTLSVDFDEGRGYLLTLPGIGAYRVASDGRRVACHPEEGVEGWRWQRALVNQVLPLAATIRGLEVLHAGAVAIDGRAFALVGHPGAGKSSTTLNLILRGATFVTDDALAIERVDDEILAHPGAGVSNFPRSERDTMEAGEPERLGEVIGDGGARKSLLAVQREEGPLPLGALYFLRRGAVGAETAFEPVRDASASMLLASTYVLSVRSPRRLANQLDLCAALARGIPIFDVLIPDSVPASESAEALLEHARSLHGALA